MLRICTGARGSVEWHLSFNLNAQNLNENKIIAKVGGQIITSVDLINEMKIIAILNRLNPNEINSKKLKENAMNNLIRLSIKKNEIIRFGANSYSANEYENIIKNILNFLKLNMNQFNEVLNTNSITYDFSGQTAQETTGDWSPKAGTEMEDWVNGTSVVNGTYWTSTKTVKGWNLSNQLNGYSKGFFNRAKRMLATKS